MRLISWNVNGIRAAERKGFLDFMNHQRAEIVCVQETKAHPEQLSKALLEIDGYHVHAASAEKKGYSGVMTYSKIEPLKVTKGLGIERFDKEGRTLIMEFDTFKLLNIYFPNGKMGPHRLKFKLEFYDAFLKYCKRQEKPVIVCGDVNTAHNEIDLARPKNNEKISGFLREERDWLDKFSEEGLIDTFRHLHPETVKYSWWSLRTAARKRNVGWRIDYFYVSKPFMKHVKDAFILTDVMGSDHCPIGITLDI